MSILKRFAWTALIFASGFAVGFVLPATFRVAFADCVLLGFVGGVVSISLVEG